jgi:hypothetical protein
MNPIEILTGYRLGGHQATVELQQTDSPGIHIDFDVLKLVPDIQSGTVRSVILTGTAGDGKTYLAFRILDALGIDRQAVIASQAMGGYAQAGVYVDLDLSAGALTMERVKCLHAALSQPERLALVCANEGKLSELQERLAKAGYELPATLLRVNLSERALVGKKAWDKILQGVLQAPFWNALEPTPALPIDRNRMMLQDATVAEHLRRYLLLPFLLGEPITVRETLSFLAYALTGELLPAQAEAITGPDVLPYLFFNTIFSEPAGYVHGGRAVPGEKLLWWMFRFDPGAMANPKSDLRLLTELDQLDVVPPGELCDFWRNQVAIRPDEDTDTAYRQRVGTFMRYARRWYALTSPVGHAAYFPFRHYAEFLAALGAQSGDLDDQIPDLVKGLNLLLSGGAVSDSYSLNLYHMATQGVAAPVVIYCKTSVDASDFELASDVATEGEVTEGYLERHPRRLYLCYPAGKAPDEQIRLPISLMLYEVLMGAASPGGGFPATLWIKEQHTVSRFMSALNHVVKRPPVSQFVIDQRGSKHLKMDHDPKLKHIKITAG